MSKAIDYISSCGGAGFTWENKTNSFSVQKNFGYFVDTETQAVTATLPSSTTVGDSFYIVDQNGTANSATPIVVEPNGGKIQGSSDPMIISSPYTSIYMVYANNIDGWVVADGKAGDCGIAPTDNIIPVDTTIYLAPSASVDGVIPVGSDIDGDGSYEKPFYSIKRAIEFLENYRIKVGVYVIIEGLPGIYNYNFNDHRIDINHKDAKYIKIKFQHMESGYYHQTTVTTDTVTKDSSTLPDADLITFKVNDIGTGHNQIKQNDYIKILADNNLWDNPDYAVWNGYYKVYSVDIGNNEITIIDQKETPLNTGHGYKDKSTLSTANTVSVYKLSTHINIDFPSFSADDEFFIKSEFGFGGIQINAASTEFYTGNFIYIYDGVLNDCVFIVSNFYSTHHFENLQIHFNNSVSYSVFTSCFRPIYLLQSTGSISGITINNCNDGLTATSSILTYDDITLKFVSMNNYYHGVDIRQTYLHISSDKTSSKLFNIFYCSDGVVCFRSSSVTGSGQNYRYNTNGVRINNNSLFSCFGSQALGTEFSYFMYNRNGILIDSGSYSDISYVNASHNTNCGIIVSNNSMILSQAEETWNVITEYNANSGVQLDGGKINITRLYSANNTNYGLYCTRNSNVVLYDMYIQDNAYGMAPNRGSRIILYSTNSSYDVKNNTTKNINCYLGGWVNAYMKTTLTDTTPAVNTTPSYSAGASSDCYVVSTTY